jgi:peroxiredoxin family protein
LLVRGVDLTFGGSGAAAAATTIAAAAAAAAAAVEITFTIHGEESLTQSPWEFEIVKYDITEVFYRCDTIFR